MAKRERERDRVNRPDALTRKDRERTYQAPQRTHTQRERETERER